MSVSEHDLEILEGWLDGELPDEQAESFRARLSVEPQLADAAARLRGDRELRARMWQALEPSDSEIETLVSHVRRDMRKEDLITSRLRTFGRIASIAASIAVVFAAGWLSRSRLRIGDTISPANTVVATVPQTGVQPVSPNTTPALQVQPVNVVMQRGANAGRNPGFSVSDFANPQRIDANKISQLAPNYQVWVVDPVKREIIFHKELERVDDAMQFANYVSRFQPGSEAIPHADPSSPSMNVVPVNEVKNP